MLGRRRRFLPLLALPLLLLLSPLAGALPSSNVRVYILKHHPTPSHD